MGLKEKLRFHKNIIESFLSLSTINAINLVLPLISLPYMLRVIGTSYYGIYSYIYVIEEYLLLFTTFGFIYSATKDISQNRGNKDTINQIYTSVLLTKFVIFVFVTSIFLIISPLLLHSKDEYLMFFIGLGIVIGDIIMPTHLYQGLERMRYLTIINITPKLIFTILIFVVVKQSSDYKYIIFLNSIGYVLGGVLSTLIAHKCLKVSFVKVGYKDIIKQIKGSLSIFASNIGISFYRNANVLILGMFCSSSATGIYSGAEKIIKAIQGVANPLSQALFPHASNVLKNSTPADIAKYIINLCIRITPLLLLGVILAYTLSPKISDIILGKEFSQAIPLIRIMSVVILFGCLNYILGFIGMVNENRSRLFFKYVVISGIVNILISTLFSYYYSYHAAACALTISEILLFCLCVAHFIKIRNHKDTM